MLPDLNLAGCPSVAHLDQYAGAWCIEPKAAKSLIRTVNNLNLAVHVQQHQPEAEQTAREAKAAIFETVPTGGSAGKPSALGVVRVEGLMTKYGSSMSSGGSTVLARRRIRAAADDESVSGILLILDTPGGTVSGTVDLALEVREAAKKKPVYAYCEDICCSGGYFVASQATRICANSNAIVGSIGVYLVLEDWSKAFDEAGVKVHVVKFGDLKGAGAFGTEITEEILEEDQKLVDAHGDQFVSFVQKGRGISQAKARELADGRVYVGQEAVTVGLVDKIQSLEETLKELAKAKAGTRAKAAGTADPLLSLDLSEPLAADVTADAGDAIDDDADPETDTGEAAAASENDSPTLEEDTMSTAPAAAAAPTADAPPTPATYKQIAAGCKGFSKDSGDDALFANSCLERELTLDACKDEWSETLAARLETREQELAEAQKAPAATTKPAGNKPVEDGDTTASGTAAVSGDPVAQWEEAVAANVAKGMTKKQAASAANRANPGLREAAVAAWNART
jgi:signal peptide peptidase SppA